MKRQYFAQPCNGYTTVEEFGESKRIRTVITITKPAKLGQQIANLLNAAYQQGRDDAAGDIARAFTAINAADARKAVQPTDKFSLETEGEAYLQSKRIPRNNQQLET